MKLIPDDIRRRLLANGAADGETDHVPVCKLFDPTGAATWLITEVSPDDPDILFGLCDLGFGFPELGSVSLCELAQVSGRLGLGIERDLHFVGRYPLSVYAEAARAAGGIPRVRPTAGPRTGFQAEHLLRQTANALARRADEPPPTAS